MTKVLAAGLAVLALAAAPAADSSSTAASLDKRSRSIVYLVRECGRGVTLAVTVVSGGTPVQASEAVNLVKGACDRYQNRLLRISTSGGLGPASDSAFGALNYWERGLGRLSDYIDNNRPSDFATAKRYLTNGKAFSTRCIRQVNALRAKKGLSRL